MQQASFGDAGDPARLVHHLGLGVWALLASPAAGLVQSARGQGPGRAAAGLALGLRSAAANTIFAVANAAAKMSGAAHSVCNRFCTVAA